MAEGVILKDTLNSHWKQDKSAFGFRMLQKMGWTEEKGLGKNEDGMSDAVKVKRREEGLGLGMENVTDDKVGSKAWSSTVSSFNSVLEMLKNNYRPADNDDEDDSKQKKKKSKKDKKEKKQKPLVTVGIKYKKFRDAKTLSDKSFHDKQAIFGHGHVHHAVTTTTTATSTSSSVQQDKQVEVKKTIRKIVVEDVESLDSSEHNETSEEEEDEVVIDVVEKKKKDKKSSSATKKEDKKKNKKEAKKRKREESGSSSSDE